MITSMNSTPLTRTATFPALLEQQAREQPEGVALVFEGSQLSFRALNERTNAVGNFLLSQGVTRQARIGLAMQRGTDQLETLVLLLGVLKIATYIPMILPQDTEPLPVERLKFIREDAGISHILTQRRFAQRLSRVIDGSRTILWCVDELGEELSRTRRDAPSLPNSHDLAYILYTTGTTQGRPKGVMIEHRSLHHFAQVQNAEFSVGPGSLPDTF